MRQAVTVDTQGNYPLDQYKTLPRSGEFYKVMFYSWVDIQLELQAPFPKFGEE